MEHEIELRLKWHHTWPDKDSDFVAKAPGYDGPVARIYETLKAGSLEMHWFWSMTAHGPEISHNAGDTSGYEATPREAAKRAEDAWFFAIKGSSLDVATPQQPRNSYAAAKGRD